MKQLYDEYRSLWARMGDNPRLRAFTVVALALYLLVALSL